MIAVALAWGAVQLLTAAPGNVAPVVTRAAAVAALPPVPGSYFAIVLVSVNHEPLHDIAPGYVPDVFYADRASCLKGTRASVRPMADAGIRGRFLCMYPREPDAELDAEPREEF